MKKWVVLMKNVTKSEHLSLKMSILLMKNPNICCSRWAGIVLMKNLRICCWNRWYWWKMWIFVLKKWVLLTKNLSICVSIWYLRWQFPYPLSYPLLMVFYGIKWEINPKLVKINLNEWNLMVFFWNLNGVYEIRGIDVVWILDLQFEWNVCWFSGIDRSKYCWWNLWDFVMGCFV